MILEKKHKRKKPAQGWFVKYDAGNVPVNNAIFNSGVGAQGTGQAMGEELDAENNKSLGIYKLIGTTPQSRNIPYYYISDNLQNISQLLDKLSKGKNRWKLICNIKSYDEDTDSYSYVDVPNWERYDITTEGALDNYIALHKPNIIPTKNYPNVYKCMKKAAGKNLTESIELQMDELKSLLAKNKSLILERNYKELYKRLFDELRKLGYGPSYISNLTDILLEANIDFLPYIGEAIPYYCFYYSDIDSINIPPNIETIHRYAFAICNNITSITIPKTVKAIGDRAFICLNLKEIIIKNKDAIIATSAFSECQHLQDIYYAGSKEDWVKNAIDVPDGTTIHYNS